MTDDFIASDAAILDLLRKSDELTVAQLAESLEVTATAVRQRLARLRAQGYIERETAKASRGRPSHYYRLTEQGRRRTASNFADLAVALWEEIRLVRDEQVRRGLLQRISTRLAAKYADQISGNTLEERMRSLSRVFNERRIPFAVEVDGGLPVLTALACPYPELAENDRGVCAMERVLFSELLGENVRLNRCRLDGENCCTFEMPRVEIENAPAPINTPVAT